MARHEQTYRGMTDAPPPDDFVTRLEKRLHRHIPSRLLRKIVVVISGTLVLLVGIVMIVAPGPAFIVIPMGLVILSLEFLWAKKLLDAGKGHIDRYKERRKNRRSS